MYLKPKFARKPPTHEESITIKAGRVPHENADRLKRLVRPGGKLDGYGNTCLTGLAVELATGI